MPPPTRCARRRIQHTVKAAVSAGIPKVPMAVARRAVAATCYADVRSMPGADKATEERRPNANMADGNYTDYFQWKSGEGGGRRAARRPCRRGAREQGWQGAGPLRRREQGRRWTVTFTRKLTGGDGDLALAEGQSVPFGIAIHTDKTLYHFHHVSLRLYAGHRRQR